MMQRLRLTDCLKRTTIRLKRMQQTTISAPAE
jgi:hypothetical protein